MARKKLAQRRLTVLLHAPEAEVVDKATEKGYNMSEVIRTKIREWGREEFPPTPAYAEAMLVRAEKMKQEMGEKKRFDQMTDEYYAENILGGQVRGDKVFFRLGGGREWNTPLATIKEKTVQNDELIALHKSLLDRTFTYNGRVPSEGEWKDIWDGWSERRPAWFELRENGQWPLREDGSVPEPGERSKFAGAGVPEDELEI